MSTKTYRIFKKLSSIVMVFALLLGLLTVSNNAITAKAADSPVKMYCCDAKTNSDSTMQYTVYIQIAANSAANKSVLVHYRINPYDWTDTYASYFTKLDSQTEIWKATITGSGLTEYAIKYVGDGNVYWDNNNGKNYLFSEPLGTANILALRIGTKVAGNYQITAAVKNLAFAKVVKVKYTEDNWKTYKEVPLNYLYSMPNSSTEIWTVSLNLNPYTVDQFHYCLSYQVNGQTYWDNNWGENYNFYYQ
ncbi:MAG: CBM21 domain-containing protein [Lachnospiraceae bacterium]|nr:CBM21 domain-containing protein [Lachnospiraceae bacterium]